MSRNEPNWLLRGLILASVAVHVFVLAYVSGFYDSRPVTYIELTLRHFSSPKTRTIPRPPRPTETAPEVVRTVPQAQASPSSIRPVEPIQKESQNAAGLTNGPVETASAPEMPPEISDVPAPPITQWLVGPQATDDSDASTRLHTYLDLVKSQIEDHRTYPIGARRRGAEGRVSVQFAIMADGSIDRLEIIEACRHQILNQAALEAVKKAAPFPRPPVDIVKNGMPLIINIPIRFEVVRAG